jgi:hypothetical protein
MAHTLSENRAAYEAVRYALTKAPTGGIDVSTILSDTDFMNAVADENERKAILVDRNGKSWVLSEKPKFAGNVTLSGTAAGDGDITLAIGNETFSITPSAGDDEATMGAALAGAINGTSGTWTASATGGSVRIVPLNPQPTPANFVLDVSDTGVTGTVRNPDEAPLDIVLGGTVKLIGRGIDYIGSAAYENV